MTLPKTYLVTHTVLKKLRAAYTSLFVCFYNNNIHSLIITYDNVIIDVVITRYYILFLVMTASIILSSQAYVNEIIDVFIVS